MDPRLELDCRDFTIEQVQRITAHITAVMENTAEQCARIAEDYLIPDGTPEGCDIARIIRERFKG